MLLIHKIYILIFLLLIIIVIIKFRVLCNKSYKNIERFDKSLTCPDTIKDKTNFCQYDLDEDKCVCKFQKDNLDKPFNSFRPCCTEQCHKKGKEDCVKDRGVYYWCIHNNKCVRQNAYIENNKISGNNCGVDVLTNNTIIPFNTEKECNAQIDPCNIYKNKTLCLRNINCGYCTNIENVGKCVEGTASGPINIYKYNFCLPNKEHRNSWFHNRNLFFQ